MKKLTKGLLIGTAAAVAAVGGLCLWLKSYLPDTYQVTQGSALVLAQQPYVKVSREKQLLSKSRSVENISETGKFSVQLRLLGIIPIKTVWVEQTPQKTVTVSGAPFGIKLFSDGLMVVGFSDVYTVTGYENPAKSAGLRMGDTVRTLDGQAVTTNQAIKELVESSDGRPMTVEYIRQGEEKTAVLTPAKDSSTGKYRIGMWVRDSSAGIGTLTCYDTAARTFAGLGHAITDVDTGETIKVLTGEIVPVTITSVAPSSAGSPGELKGILADTSVGTILNNTTSGVYGRLTADVSAFFGGREYPAANRQQVTVGEAVLYTCLNGSAPKAYTVEIERISYHQENANKNMIIHITDPELLDTAGGIVQGMSGSPIIQNGFFVGAVTHVLVNDPTRGYAIFAQTMLETPVSDANNALAATDSGRDAA